MIYSFQNKGSHWPSFLPFSIGPHTLSRAGPPVFLAEIGAFFGQDIVMGKELISEVALARDSIPELPIVLKTEILHDEDVCLPGDTAETYESKSGEVRQENYRALIQRKVVPLHAYEELLQHCAELSLSVVVSIYDFAGVDFAVEMGASGLKIASSNVIHYPLIEYAASKGVPLIIDTGRATIDEVYRAVKVAEASGCHHMVIEHSPDGHPSKPAAHNLLIMDSYQKIFGYPVGLSDHHVGHEMLYMAIALGATVLEKGVHSKPDELDIDISHTMGIDDLPRVLRTVHDCWQALGQPHRDMSVPISGTIGTSQRQCVVARDNLEKGALLSLETIRFAFPTPVRGISVEHWSIVNGWKIKNRVKKGKPVMWTDIQAV